MPTRPATFQPKPQQRAIQDKLYCKQHRLASDPRSTARWRRCREIVLSRQPFCIDPFRIHSQPVAATEVDHIVAVAVDSSQWFRLENLQGLCRLCHARKSGEERAAINKERRAQIKL